MSRHTQGDAPPQRKAKDGAKIRAPALSLVLAFIAVTVSFIAATVYSQLWAMRIDQDAILIARNASPSIEHLARAREALRHFQGILAGEVHKATRGQTFDKEKIQAARERLDEHLRAYLEIPYFPGERSLWADVQSGMKKLHTTTERLMAQERDDERDAAELTMEQELNAAVEAVSDALLRSIDFNAEYTTHLALRIEEHREQATWIAFGLDLVGVLAALFAGVVVFRVVRTYGRLHESHHRMLARKAEELEAFAGRVAHDITSPLGAVGLALDMTRRKVSDEKVLSILERGKSGLGRTQSIVSDLLSFARSGASPAPGARADIAEIMRQVTEGLLPQATDARIHLKMEPVACEVACAPGVLTSMVSNLLRNAIKYMGESEQREITIRALEQRGRVRVEVADTGAGIPPELLDLIFLPYARGLATTQPGLGLGLATVRRLAEAHGGQVGVRSEMGRGSLFWFELPKSGQ